MLAISSPGVIKMLVNRFFELRGPHYSCSLESRGAAVMERELDEAAPLGTRPVARLCTQHHPPRAALHIRERRSSPSQSCPPTHPAIRRRRLSSLPGARERRRELAEPACVALASRAAPVPFFGYDTPRKESLGRGV